MKILFLFTSLFFSTMSYAQVERSQLTDMIAQREPVNDLGQTVNVSASGMRKIYFFTQINNLAHQQITHRWLYQGEEKAAVTLNIGSDNWRTYSSKLIPAYWSGEWQVQVWYGDLQLVTQDFTVVVETE